MGKYLHYFLTKGEFAKKYFSEDYEKHWTSLTVAGYKSNYDKTRKKLAKTPLTLVPLTDYSTTFNFAIAANVNTDTLESISYSVDGGETWVTTSNVDGTAVNVTVTVTNRQPVMWKGVGKAISVSDSVYSRFTANWNFAAFGNPLSLLSERYNLIDLYSFPWSLANLFRGNTYLIHASDLMLTARRCGSYCYSRMFDGCTNLETYPEIKAVRMWDYCCYFMFENCKKMVTPISLPSTKLKAHCYDQMFKGCTGLTSVPDLPATTMASYCYSSMFEGCTGLVDCEINLPGTTMASYCYNRMFYGCNKLTTAPVLPATKVYTYSYADMFYGCTSLTSAPALPATSLGTFCYSEMFYNCTGLTDIPEIVATQIQDQCYKFMFRGCNGLTDLSGHTFPVVTSGANAYVYMFQDCKGLTKAPALPTTSLTGSYFYRGMFKGCSALTQAPALPATTANQWCYAEMFYGCTSLTTMPTINLNSLYVSCFQEMFRGCTSLVNVMSVFPWKTLANACFSNMFYGCTSLATAPKLPAKTLVNTCYNGMFNGCSNINNIVALFTTNPNSVSSCNSNWVFGVSATGTFTKLTSATWDPDDYRGVNGVPTGWTVNTTEPILTENDNRTVVSSGNQVYVVKSGLIDDYNYTINDPDNVFTIQSNSNDRYNITCSDSTSLHIATLTFASPGAEDLVLTLINNEGTLPNTYRRVGYVEADGNQQIDLNLNMFGTAPVDYGVQLVGYLDSTSVAYGTLLANVSETSPYPGTAIRKDNTNNNVHYRANGANTIIKATNTLFSVNYTGTNTSAFTCKTTLFGAINTNDSSWWRFAKGKIYACKIIVNNTVVRNLIPCVEIATSTAGLYDIVNSTFYTSETDPLLYAI